MWERRRTLRCLAGAAGLAAGVATLPAAVQAQASQGTVEVGAALLSQRNVPSTHAATAGISFRHDATRFALAAAGGLTLADENRSTSQGLFAASLLGRPGRWARWEVGGALTAFDQSDLPMTAGAYVVTRAHFSGSGFGGWAGVGIGGVEDLEYWSPTRSAELAVWYSSRFARLSGAAVLIDTRSEPYGPQSGLITDPVTYTDGSVGVHWIFRRRLEVDARGGMRFISRGALTPTGRGTRPFAAVDAAFRITPQVALAAAVGRQLSDLARGTPDTRFAALSLRFTMRNPPVGARAIRQPPASDRPRLALLGDGSGQARLVVTAPRAVVVELAATFTSWEPVPLVRRGDQWELDRSVPSGAHRVLVRVDGGPWVVPANLPAAADDFGGTVGIVTVP